MFIHSKDGEILLNLDHTMELFVSHRDGEYSLIAKTVSGSNLVMGRYETKKRAKTALSKVYKDISLGKNTRIANDKEVDADIIMETDIKPHHIKGKKTKGHGGS